jgi:hypothetical protein
MVKRQPIKQASGRDEGAGGQPAPNVRLGAEAKPLGEGPVTVGTEVICVLPSADAQRAGFYCENPGRLVRLYPGRFKFIVGKGN